MGEAKDEVHPFLRESVGLARKGESRASLLEGLGWGVVALGALAVILAIVNLVDEWSLMLRDERIDYVLLILWITIGNLVVAAVFFGFAALVRNTSRTLSLQAILTRAASADVDD